MKSYLPLLSARTMMHVSLSSIDVIYIAAQSPKKSAKKDAESAPAPAQEEKAHTPAKQAEDKVG
jgi:hypothetical protein